MTDLKAFQVRIGRIDELVRRLDSAPDPALRATVRELLQAAMDLHGAGLERIVELISTTGGDKDRLLAEMGSDELVGGLLVLHELHPEAVEVRVRRAAEKLGPMLRAQGASMSPVTFEEGVVKLEIRAPVRHREAVALRKEVEEVIYASAPDVAELEVEVIEGPEAASNFVPLESFYAAPSR